MFFGLTAEQQEYRHALRDFFARTSTSQRIRQLMSDDRGHDHAAWERMAGDLGVQGLAIPEQYGGSGASFVELAVALDEAGYALAGGPLFASSVLASTCLQESGDAGAMARYLPGIAAGQLIATLAMSGADAAWDPDACPGVQARPGGDGYVLTGAASYVLEAQLADVILVVAQADDGPTLVAVDKGAAGLTQTALPLLDPTRRVSRLDFDRVSGRLVGVAGGAGPAVTRTLLAAAVALGAEQAGGMRRCLEMAVAYAKIRVQFGRPVGGFQAIKHLCADMYTLVETAHSAVLYASWCLAADASDLDAVAHLTKAYCSDAYVEVAAGNIQVHGGIGFTWEHDCHLFFRRAAASRQFLGSPSHHREMLARAIRL